jgi:FkbM family methyltransferase
MATAFNGLGLWRGSQTVWGHGMKAKTFDRSLYLLMHRVGLMGRSEKAAMAELVKPGMTVVDVGANLGLYTLYMAGLVGPTGRVIAFEPDPDLVEILRENCSANGVTNVEVHNCALGAEPDHLILHRLTLNSGENHLGSKERGAFRRPVEVVVATFDSLLPDVRPDFVKVDVQGWELNVLKGMRLALLSSRPKVYVELWPEGLRRAGSSPKELYTFIREAQLDFYSGKEWSPVGEQQFLEMATSAKGMAYFNLLASSSRPAAHR